MSQPDIAIQPRETSITADMRSVARAHDWAVEHSTDGKHSDHSLHYLGRALDLADRSGPEMDSADLLRINKEVLQFVPLPYIQELIYNGPGAICVYHGRILTHAEAYQIYTAEVMREHDNHVHWGVTPNFTYNGSQEVHPPMPNDPNLPDIVGPVQFDALQDSAGNCTGYFIFSHSTGELHAFGPGAKFYGRSEVVKLVTA